MSATRGLDLAAAGLLLFGAVVRLVGFLQNASLIGDEAMLALSIGRRSFKQLLQPLDYGQVATVPFLWAERLVTLVGGVSGYSLRVVPLLAGTGLLWAVYRLTRDMAGRLEAVVALALAATSYPLIRYSVEVKPYIVDSLVSVLLIWIALRLVENLEDRWRWIRLALGGVVGVLFSPPALLVSVAVLVGLAVAAVRRGRLNLLFWLVLLGLLWAAISGAAYVSWYAPNAGAPYMRVFWAEAFLRPGTPRLLHRLWFAATETGCTLTCWRGAFDLTPGLLLFAGLGTSNIWHRRGPEYTILVAGPLVAAFLASALGRYPIATRLMLFSAPLLCTMVAAGMVAFASLIQRRFSRIRTRWVLLLFLYPSIVVAAALTFTRPIDWGLRGVDIGPLAEEFQRHGETEPIYVFARSVPAWVFHTTYWAAPDTSRLTFAARTAGPEGPGFIDASSRGGRVQGEGADLIYHSEHGIELYGTPTGSQARAVLGHVPRTPDPGWAESEAWRIRVAAEPFIWIVMSDFVHTGADERQVLMEAVENVGGTVVYSKSAPDAVLYRIRFQAGAVE